MSNIKEALQRLFETNRLVFWYDAGKEMLEEYESLEFDSVKKIKVEQAGFGLKYQLIKEEPQQNFLLYFQSEEPDLLDNWLLDLQLSQVQFSTDKASIYTQELSLPENLKRVVKNHLSFFEAKSRRKQFYDRLSTKISEEEFKGKILAATLSARSESIEQIFFAYLDAWMKDREKLTRDLNRYNLHGFLWEKIKRVFYYTSDEPSVYGFLVSMFRRASSLFNEEDVHLKATSLLKGWQDSQQYNTLYRELSKRVAKDLEVESILNTTDLFDLTEDYFRISEKKILFDLSLLADEEKPETEKGLIKIRNRRSSFWYPDFQHVYAALEYGYSLMQKVLTYNQKARLVSVESILKGYAEDYYQVDQFYRKFIYSYTLADENELLVPIYTAISREYMNQFIPKINIEWTDQLAQDAKKINKTGVKQRDFYQRHVHPLLEKGQRVVVIISDAFRYEIGVEFAERLRAEKRYEADTEIMLSSLPSYTQLGMAALLPHKEIELIDNGTTVNVDGKSSKGLKNRASILETNSKVSATAINAKDLLRMESKTEGRDFIKQHDLVYVYNNTIDKTGDDKVSEHGVFDAVERELDNLVLIVKKLNNMNVYKMVVTADHGFLYEHEEVHSSDFLLDTIEGDEGININRRFAMGTNIKKLRGVSILKSEELGYKGGVQIALPHSVNRFRVKGAGSRFVHGGWSIQEMAIPAVVIAKKREEVVKLVDIDIIKSSDKITSNILPVTFIQSRPVDEYIHPRLIKAYLVALDGTKLSNTFEYAFDFDLEADRARKESFRFQFRPGITSKYRNQDVKLVLETPISSDHWKVYKEYTYTLMTSFISKWDHD